MKSVAMGVLHSYRNLSHERVVADGRAFLRSRSHFLIESCPSIESTNVFPQRWSMPTWRRPIKRYFHKLLLEADCWHMSLFPQHTSRKVNGALFMENQSAVCQGDWEGFFTGSV